MKKYDYIIIGQGIAGSWLARSLLKMGKSVLVVDKNVPVSSSGISAGIINPVTGKNFVKTWKATELLSYARMAYEQFEKEAGIRVFRELQIYRLFKNEAHRAQWLAKYDIEELGEFVINKDLSLYNTQLYNPHGGFLMKGAVLSTNLFLEYLRNEWREKGILTETNFEYKELKTEEPEIQWRDILASKVVFAEGWHALKNPYFSWLPFNAVKGELLTIKAPKLRIEMLVNRGIFLLPLGEDIYRVGATYTWDQLDAVPSAQARTYLEQEIGKLIQTPFQILDHQAGVRPATHDRRPFLGRHPIHRNMFIFNGMGTKGISLAPYFAHQMADYLERDQGLDPEADIQRFRQLCK